MDNIAKILRQIPLFRHCTAEEMGLLYKNSRLTRIKKGQRLDVKTLRALCIVLDGVFEIEALASSDVVYLAPGSFFGNIPFIQDRQHGIVKSLTEASLLMMEEDKLKLFFLQSFKSLRGYAEILHRLGFDSTEAARNIQNKKCKIVTVFSSFDKTGKTLLTSLVATKLAEIDRVIVLDVSNQGSSVFDYFNMRITPPLSQKQIDNSSTESLLMDRIEVVHDNLSILNVSYGSKVSINSKIISPLIFYLSQHYKYIVMDLTGENEELAKAVFTESDIVLGVTRIDKSQNRMSEFIDKNVRQGQRVINIYNEYSGGQVKRYDNGLIFEKIIFENSNEFGLEVLSQCQSETVSRIVELIIRKNKILVMESNLLEAVALAPFLEKERDSGGYTSFYTSSFSYLILVFYLLSGDKKETYERIKHFFSENRLNGILDIVFPEDYVFRKDKISKRMYEIAGNRRIENFSAMPVSFASSASGRGRLFSSGMVKDSLETSFVLEPVFEPVVLNGEKYYSGYPHAKVSVEEVLRSDADEITYLSVHNSEKMDFKGSRILNFYQNFINHLEERQEEKKNSELADKSVQISIDQKYFSIDAIIEAAEKN